MENNENTASRSPGMNSPIPRNRYITYVSLASLGTGADLLSKQLVFQWRGIPGQLRPWWLIEPYVGVETAVNLGALFGLGRGYGTLFAGLSVAAAIFVWTWLFYYRAATSRWLTVAMGLITGGILGNLYDRLGIPDLPVEMRGGVRDWILLCYKEYTWPNFNIADSLLVTGAIMLAIHSVFLSGGERRTQVIEG